MKFLPPALIGKSLKDSKIREKSNCNVLAIGMNGMFVSTPVPSHIFEKDQELILIGTLDSEKKFLDKFVE